MPKVVTKPYGGTTPAQDKKIERCVNSLMANPKFKPRKKGQTKKEAAIAVCKESILNSNKTNNMSKKAFQFKAPMLIGSSYIQAEMDDGIVKKFACEKSLKAHLFKTKLVELEKKHDVTYEEIIAKTKLSEDEKEFKKEVEDGIEKTKIGSVKNKKYIIEGVASTSDIDLDEERMAPSAIKSMADSAKGRNIPLRNAHRDEWDTELGTIFEVKASNNNTTLKIKTELDNFDENSKAKDLWAKLQKGAKLGLSIGGVVVDFQEEFVKELNKNITCYLDIVLVETSVTKMPANIGTFVHALTKSYNKANAKNNFLTNEEMTKLIGKTINKDADSTSDEPTSDESTSDDTKVVDEEVSTEEDNSADTTDTSDSGKGDDDKEGDDGGEGDDEEANGKESEDTVKSKEEIEQFEKAAKDLAKWYPEQSVDRDEDIEKTILPKVDEVMQANPLFTTEELVKAVVVLEPTFGEVAEAVAKANPAVETPVEELSLKDMARQISAESAVGKSSESQEAPEKGDSDTSDAAPESPVPEKEGTDEEAGNSKLDTPLPEKSKKDDSDAEDVEKNVVEDEIEDVKTARQARWMKWDKAYPLWNAARNVYIEGKSDFATVMNDLAEALQELVKAEKVAEVKTEDISELISKAIEPVEKAYKEEMKALKAQIEALSDNSVVYKSTSSDTKSAPATKHFSKDSNTEEKNEKIKGSVMQEAFKKADWGNVEPFDVEKEYTEDEAVEAISKAYPGDRKPANVYNQKQLVRQLFGN